MLGSGSRSDLEAQESALENLCSQNTSFPGSPGSTFVPVAACAVPDPGDIWFVALKEQVLPYRCGHEFPLLLVLYILYASHLLSGCFLPQKCLLFKCMVHLQFANRKLYVQNRHQLQVTAQRCF